MVNKQEGEDAARRRRLRRHAEGARGGGNVD
jgi:hypothetical protein